jgi:VWFA-related protein
MLRLILASLAVSLAWGQEPRFSIGTDEVVAPVTVVDKRTHKFVNGLEAKDFTLTDNGKIQDIKVEVSYIPISLVVAIQANNMVEPFLPKIKKIGPLIEGLLIGQQGEAAIMKFDHRMIWMTDGFTNDGRAFTRALERINPGSSTSAMVDAVFETTRTLRNRPKTQRRILLLIAETRDKGSEGRLREALLTAQENNIIVYSVNINRLITNLAKKMDPPRPDHIPATARPVPGGAPQTPGTIAAMTGYGSQTFDVIPLIKEMMTQVKAVFVPNPLEVLTRYTGGREYAFLSQRDLEDVVTQLGEELHSQYLIYYRPNNQEEGGWHDIKVTLNRSNLEIRTRDGYYTAAKYNKSTGAQ